MRRGLQIPTGEATWWICAHFPMKNALCFMLVRTNRILTHFFTQLILFSILFWTVENASFFWLLR